MLRGGVDFADRAGGVDRQQRLRQRVEQLQRVERRVGGRRGRRHHAASVSGCDGEGERQQPQRFVGVVAGHQRPAQRAPARPPSRRRRQGACGRGASPARRPSAVSSQSRWASAAARFSPPTAQSAASPLASPRATRADQPRRADRGAADHHRLRARLGEHRPRVVEAAAVAVDHHRRLDRGDHLGDRAPIGPAVIKLAAGAAMDGDHRRPGGFGPTRQRRRVAFVVVPAEPHLDADRRRHGAGHRFDQPARLVEIAHQRAAGRACRRPGATDSPC